MAKIIGPSGPQTAPPTPAPEAAPAKPKATDPNAQGGSKAAEDLFGRGAAGLGGYKSSPLVSGAMKIFSDGVLFPSGLVDPKDPKNDPKYLRLLAAVLGLDELERHFVTLEGEEQQEYLEHKAEQRERKLAKVEEEKEEKRRQREQSKEEATEEKLEEEDESA